MCIFGFGYCIFNSGFSEKTELKSTKKKTYDFPGSQIHRPRHHDTRWTLHAIPSPNCYWKCRASWRVTQPFREDNMFSLNNFENLLIRTNTNFVSPLMENDATH